MTKTSPQLMVERLQKLQASTPDVQAAAIVSADGLTVSAALPGQVEEDRVAAMSAAMLSLAERITSEFGRGSLEQVTIEGENGYILLTAVGPETVLTVMAGKAAKLSPLHRQIRRLANDLTGLLQQGKA